MRSVGWRWAPARFLCLGLGGLALACTFDPPAAQRSTDGGGDTGDLDLGDLDLGPSDAPSEDGGGSGPDATFPDAGPSDQGVDVGPLDPPGVQSVALAMPANTSTVVTLSGRPVGADPLSFRLMGAGTLGQVTLNGDRLEYQAPPDYAGPDRIRFVAMEGAATSSVGTVDLLLWDNRSCAQVRDTAPAPVVSGAYRLDPDGAGPGAAVVAWCEMQVDGGGWTLVGRSVVGGTASRFGWGEATGAVLDDTQPYSLDAASTGINFDRMLVTTHAGDKAIVDAYRLRYDDNFWGNCGDRGCDLDRWFGVAGGCPTSLNLSPTMLFYAGHHQLSDHFFFRDNSGAFETGLRADGWDTYYNACAFGAGLNGRQGMIFVRCDDVSCALPSW